MIEPDQQRIDPITIIGLGLILMPVLTMWHEIGGHVSACLLTGGRLRTIGAFYIDCDSVTLMTQRIVACAGVVMDGALSLIAWALWSRARGDLMRLVLWLIAVSKGFVAAGYFLFSGVSGYGDLGPGPGGGIGPLADPWAWRIGFILFGALVYWWLVMHAIGALTQMLGDSAETGGSRRRIAHLYYIVIGLAAVLVGLFNPVGLVITIMSALASAFGGNAGFISIGYAVPKKTVLKPFVIPRSWPALAVGAIVAITFAVLLGPSITISPR
ncbi:hypothetical protein EAH79_02850 [Sphingomonas koreensis]|nr:hypothetical protein EAH79_02850 [Sphingomonas koreensis]